ncbi:hypothetical protein D9M68_948850 [compost metagenome]
MQQLLPAQPVEQVVAVWRIEDFLQRVGFSQAFDIVCRGEQMQVVVAQHAGHGITHAIEKAQGVQRLGAAIDQVADQP